MTKPAEPECNCEQRIKFGIEHETTCPVYERPFTYAEIRQVRGLLKYLYPNPPNQPSQAK